MTTPPLFATWLGYLTAIVALGALVTAIAALVTRSEGMEALSCRFILAAAIGIAVTVVVALSIYVNSWASDAVCTQLFLAASLFTLAITLADWRARDVDVLWKPETRILYVGGYVGCLGLAVATVWMG